MSEILTQVSLRRCRSTYLRCRQRREDHRPAGIGRVRHRVRAQGGDVAVSPFTTPDRVLISRRPADMRAGIQRFASIVAADFGGDPQDGALYCFVSRDCEKMKMLRFDVDGWCLYYCRLAEGCFRWEHRPDYADPRLECGCVLSEMKAEVTRRVRIVPAHIVVEEHCRRVYRCGECCGANARGGERKGSIVRAPQPEPPIPGFTSNGC